MSRRVLITGGLGYLGGRIGRHLAATGRFEVTLGTRGGRPAPKLDFAARIVDTNMEDRAGLRSALQGMDHVIHLAALNDRESAADPARALQVNGEGTGHAVSAAIAAGVRRFLHVSTAHVYGAPLVGAIDETTEVKPSHPYAASHLVGEQHVLAAHQAKRIVGLVVRLSNGFGPPIWPGAQCWQLVVNDLCRQAVERRRLQLRSNGLQRRDFVPLEDVARAALHLLDLRRDQCADGLFNLGGDLPWSIYEVAQRVAERCKATLGHSVPVKRVEPAPGVASAPLSYRSSKLKATGFSPVTPPDTEIDATLQACAGWFGR
jgi:UDP-glucose 4-epimerase